jgi:hypothetical protein
MGIGASSGSGGGGEVTVVHVVSEVGAGDGTASGCGGNGAATNWACCAACCAAWSCLKRRSKARNSFS